MKFKQIVARSNNHVIGKDNQLLWNIKDDLKHFKTLTLGQFCIVGRTTYEGIKRLKGRRFIVVTRDENYIPEYDNAYIVHSIESAINLAKEICDDICMIIGGSQIYQQTMEYTDELIVTEVDINVDGDSYYEFDELKFQLAHQEETHYDANSGLSYNIITYQKI